MNETVVCRNELGGYSTPYNKDTLARLYYELQKENEHLTAENERLSKQLTDGKCVYLSDSETAEGCVQSPCPNYKTVEDILKENAELHARLEKAVILPCKVGDTVHDIYSDEICESKIKSISLVIYKDSICWSIQCVQDGRTLYFSDTTYNSLWFTDPEKAKAELKGGEQK